jgi:hypothetical protein
MSPTPWCHNDRWNDRQKHKSKTVGNTDLYKKVLTQPAEQNSTITNDASTNDASTNDNTVHTPTRTYADAVRFNSTPNNKENQNKNNARFA